MNKIIVTALTLFVVMNTIPATFAQNQRPPEWHLNQFNQRYKFAEELVAINNNQALLSLLQQARQLRDEAANAFAKGQKQLALTKLTTASRLIDQIIRTALRDPLQRMRDRLNELLQQAEQFVVGSGNMEAERLLRDAKNQKAKAVQAVLQQRYQAGLEHYRVATYLAQRAIDLVEGTITNLEERVTQERERYLELLTKAQDVVNSSRNPLAKKVLNQAIRQGLGIRNALNRKDYALALDLYYSSTRLLLRAINIAEGQNLSVEEQAKEEVDRINDLIAYIEGQMQYNEDITSGILLRNAKDLHLRAQSDLRGGRYQGALQNVELAEGIIRRLARRLARPSAGLTERVQLELERLQTDLNAAMESNRAGENETALVLLEEAQKLYQRANSAFLRGQNLLSLELILVANKLLLASDRHLETVSEPEIEVAAIRLKLQRLDTVLDEMNKEIGQNSGPAYELLDQTKILRFSANEALQSGKYVLADNLIQIAIDLAYKVRDIKK